MKFIEAMLEKGVVNEAYWTRVFRKIPTKSGYKLSVQASETHYCSPKETIALNLYDKFELAITLNSEFVYPDILNNFKRNKELYSYYDGTIFSYVPKDLIEDLYNYLNNDYIDMI